MAGDGVNLWLQKQLKPLAKNLDKVPPEIFSWGSLFLSGAVGGLLYFAQAQYWPAFALPALILLIFRLLCDSLEDASAEAQSAESSGRNRLLIGLLSRLSDLSMLLGFAFWDSLRIHLVLLAIVSMLLVSYVGELAKAQGASDCKSGLLCRSNRVILLIFFCLVYLLKPNSRIADYSVFEVMFALFIPMASITLLQRMDSAIRVKKD
ncbi:MAG: hypothetical protein K2X27_05650 [Candidatus Obscuribacterales bacterium]|nr:hypothetical protein [Candidatus Obscuribacterales bacterium]